MLTPKYTTPSTDLPPLLSIMGHGGGLFQAPCAGPINQFSLLTLNARTPHCQHTVWGIKTTPHERNRINKVVALGTKRNKFVSTTSSRTANSDAAKQDGRQAGSREQRQRIPLAKAYLAHPMQHAVGLICCRKMREITSA